MAGQSKPAAKKPDVVVIGGGINAAKNAAAEIAAQKAVPKVITIPQVTPDPEPQRPPLPIADALPEFTPAADQRLKAIRNITIAPEEPQPEQRKYTVSDFGKEDNPTAKFTAYVCNERNFTNMSQGAFEHLTIEDLKVRLDFWESAARHFQALSQQAQEQYHALLIGKNL